jgi:hypothetical protein
MIQMHSYLVTNAKTELKFIDNEITMEELDETFNQVAIAMNNNSDLFDNDEFDIDITLENHVFNEIEDLEGIDNNNLEISDFIDLSASLLANNTNFNDQDYEEESIIIDHGNTNFDIDELINSFEKV